MSKGFTLIEVLVSIAIIGVIAAVVIPNYRNFNELQNLSNSTQNFVSTLRTAESNSQTGVGASLSGCATGATPTVWGVKFSSSTNTYSLVLSCVDALGVISAMSPSPTFTTVSLPQNVTFFAPTGSCQVNFQNNAITGDSTCFPSQALQITIKDASINPPTRVITLSKGGAITCQIGSTGNPC